MILDSSMGSKMKYSNHITFFFADFFHKISYVTIYIDIYIYINFFRDLGSYTNLKSISNIIIAKHPAKKDHQKNTKTILHNIMTGG